jgi:hypothetical protein
LTRHGMADSPRLVRFELVQNTTSCTVIANPQKMLNRCERGTAFWLTRKKLGSNLGMALNAWIIIFQPLKLRMRG